MATLAYARERFQAIEPELDELLDGRDLTPSQIARAETLLAEVKPLANQIRDANLAAARESVRPAVRPAPVQTTLPAAAPVNRIQYSWMEKPRAKASPTPTPTPPIAKAGQRPFGICLHEASHICAGVALGLRPRQVAIYADGGGLAEWETITNPRHDAAMTAAGPIGELTFAPGRHNPWGSADQPDSDSAILTAIVARNGISEAEACDTARRLVARYDPSIQTVANYLFNHGIATADALRGMIGPVFGHALPAWEQKGNW